ncbi:uncharacterized protein [Littorina saxatilis]|uniref:uncharacterized protein n=1 Tax=Littorina saxatilis TaxID=31220 RepID=UPI0038B43811
MAQVHHTNVRDTSSKQRCTTLLKEIHRPTRGAPHYCKRNIVQTEVHHTTVRETSSKQRCTTLLGAPHYCKRNIVQAEVHHTTARDTSLSRGAPHYLHPWLHEVVSGTCEADSQESQRRVVNFFMDEICQTVNPEHLIRHFLSLELLGEMECEAVMRITQQKGPTLGAVYMVGHLPRSTNRHWYHDFLHVLMTNGYPELVRILDQSHYEKLLENSRSPDPLSAAPQATAMHERGEAHEDGLQNYAGVPPLSHQTLQSARGTQHGDLVLPASGACAGVKVTTAVTAVPGHEESSKRHVTTGHVYSSDVTANNHDRPEGRWAVSDRRHIYVSVSEYRGETQVHIRHYAGGKAGDDTLRPTKRGIALKLEEWNTLKSLIPHVDHDIKSRDTH